jgi:type VI secretion system secreted protein VgrG
MITYTQADRPIQITTALQENDLLIEKLAGQEFVSSLFSFQVDLLASNSTDVPFEKLLGQEATVRLQLPDNRERYFSGIINWVNQGVRGNVFTPYRAALVPKFWILTRTSQSRIFQNLSVPEILRDVLQALDPVYQIKGQFHAREYCVQYRESDFNFASRLMEEEGIYYYFVHNKGGHRMIVSDQIQVHPDVQEPTSISFEGEIGDNNVYAWEKFQELRSASYVVRDNAFQLPRNHLQSHKDTRASERLGQVDHSLQHEGNGGSEIYDYPGGYAHRYDDIDKSGEENPKKLQHIFEDSKKTVNIRMEAEAMSGLVVSGASCCGHFLPAHNFTLRKHFNADGKYMLLSVDHFISLGSAYRSGSGLAVPYRNRFTCIPATLPYRPQALTPRPIIYGLQTAYVVGPPGKEILTDKYGRIKVQFHWDRKGKFDADSSCWIRVAQQCAGKRWGASFWPRIGQEVVVCFEEGNPDKPLIIGSVYNAEQMPPYLGDGLDQKHKNDPNVSGIKTNSTLGGYGFNELRFDDTKDTEQVFMHAQRNLEITTKKDSLARTYGNQHLIIGHDQNGSKGGDLRELVYLDKHLKINRNHIEQVGGDMQLFVGGIDGNGNQDIVVSGTKKESVGKDDHLHVTGSRMEKIGGGQSLAVGGDQQEKIGQNYAVDAGKEIHLKAGMKIIIEAGVQVSVKVGGNFIDISPAGIAIQGTMVRINSGGSPGEGSGSSPQSPQDPQKANPTKPDIADDSKSGQKSART